MHAIYLFAIEDDPSLSGDDAAAAANETFNSYLEQYGDENNWSQPAGLLRHGGEVVSMCELGDWRGRDAWAESLKETPQDQRWASLMHTAWRILGYDMQVNDVSPLGLCRGDKEEAFDRLSVEEIRDLISTQVPASLARAYNRLALEGHVARAKRECGLEMPTAGVSVLDKQLEGYKRQQRSAVFEAYMRALDTDRLLGCDCMPFLPPDTPYAGWRTMRLLDDSSAEHKAILAVDIHT